MYKYQYCTSSLPASSLFKDLQVPGIATSQLLTTAGYSHPHCSYWVWWNAHFYKFLYKYFLPATETECSFASVLLIALLSFSAQASDWPEYDQMMSKPNNDPPPRVAKMMAEYKAKRAKGEAALPTNTQRVNLTEAARDMGVKEKEFVDSPQIQAAYMKKHGISSMSYARDATAEEDAELAAEEDEEDEDGDDGPA